MFKNFVLGKVGVLLVLFSLALSISPISVAQSVSDAENGIQPRPTVVTIDPVTKQFVAPAATNQKKVRKSDESADEKAVAKRIAERWDNIVAKNIEKAYGFSTENSKQLTSLAAFSNRLGIGNWKSATVDHVDCSEPTICEAYVTVKLDIVMPRIGLRPHESLVRESWVKARDEWFFVIPQK